MSSFIGNLNTIKYESLSSSNNAGKLYIPVNKTALMYSHFEHVSGVAAGSGQNGVSINRLRILNSLIERVSALKNEKPATVKSLGSNEIEKMIQAYQKAEILFPNDPAFAKIQKIYFEKAAELKIKIK